MAAASPHRVVIVGGGGGGAHLARSLGSKASKLNLAITVIDPKDYLDHAPANVRAVVASRWADFSAIAYRDLFAESVRLVQGTVSSFNYEQKQVLVVPHDNCDEMVPYDTLVIATGFRYDVVKSFKSRAERQREFDDVAKALSDAQSVAIVGAGATGVEIAGEIHAVYGKAKKVHLVSSSATILPEGNEKLRKKLLKQLVAAGVDISYNERGMRASDAFMSHGSLSLESGKSVPSDVVLWTTGGSSRTTYDVDEQLRVREGVFAIGDATRVQEPRTLYAATMHADFVAKCIIAQAKGKQFKKPYAPLKAGTVVVSFGPRGGAASLPFGTVGPFIVRMAKSKDLMLGRFYPKSLKAKLKNLPPATASKGKKNAVSPE